MSSGRPLSRAEFDALPVLARGSALRFLLTRLYDWLNVPPGALVVPHDPREYLAKLRFHQGSRRGRRLRPRLTIDAEGRAVSEAVEIWTDGACSGNPGPGGWGALLRYNGDAKSELAAARAETTNNRMELQRRDRGAQCAEAPLHDRPAHQFPICAGRRHAAGSPTGSATAGRRPPRSRSRTTICGASWTRPRPPRHFMALGQGSCRPSPKTKRPTNWPARAWRRTTEVTARQGASRICEAALCRHPNCGAVTVARESGPRRKCRPARGLLDVELA